MANYILKSSCVVRLIVGIVYHLQGRNEMLSAGTESPNILVRK